MSLMSKKINLGHLFGGDKVLWIIFAMLSAISLLVVYSSTAALAYARYGGNTSHELLFQLGCIGGGFVIMYLAHLVDIEDYNRFARLVFWVSLFLMALIYVPGIGQKVNGAYRWIKIPFTNLTFQPSDLLKTSVVILLAQQLASRQRFIHKLKLLPSFRPRDWRYHTQENINIVFDATLPILMPVALSCLSILVFNFSTAGLLFLTCLLMLIIGRVPMREVVRLLALSLALVVLLVAGMKVAGVGRADTWLSRVGIETAASRERDARMAVNPEDEAYQEIQAKIAIASGGLTGKGPGNSTQRTHLPLPYSDFAYAFITEEYGLLGAIFVLLIYLWIFYRSLLISRRCETAFPSFLVVGLGLMIVIQAMTNMAVGARVIPVTGQPLPIISKGGTSILFICLALGLI
jgi:cell division protein FtsW